MSNVIIKATNDQLSQMKAYYRSYLLNKQIPYTIFAAKRRDDHHCLHIRKSDVPRANAETEAQRWGQAQDKQAKPARTVSSLPKISVNYPF